MGNEEEYLYTKEHEWVCFEDAVAVVGIAEYAQNALGDITFVELPEIGILERMGETPDGIPVQRVVHDELVEWHAVGGYLTVALLLLHILGAVKHQWFDGEAELARMGIGRPRGASGG